MLAQIQNPSGSRRFTAAMGMRIIGGIFFLTLPCEFSRAQEKEYRIGQGPNTYLAIGPSSDIIAIDNSDLIANEKQIVLFDIKQEKKVGTIRYYPGGVAFKSLVFLKDGKSLVAAGGVKSRTPGRTTLNYWQVPSGDHIKTFELEGQMVGLTNRFVVIRDANEKGVAKVIDLESGKVIAALKNFVSNLEKATLSADGNYVATLENEGPVKIWDLKSEKIIHTLNWRKGLVRNLIYPGETPTLAVVTHGVTLYDMKTGKSTGGVGACPAMAISSNLELMTYYGEISIFSELKATKHFPKAVHVLSLKKKEVIASFHVDPKWEPRVAQFTPDTNSLIIAGSDGLIRTWDITNLMP